MIYPRRCVLFSGGIESCVLVGILAEAHEVFPFRVHYGLRWETEERAACERYLKALPGRRYALHVQPLTVSTEPVPEALCHSWSVRGPVPSAESPDASVELPQRNLMLLEAAAAFCSANRIPTMAIGTLVGSNPFPDATRAFFDDQARVLSERYGMRLRICTPLQHLRKAAVLRHGAGRALPLEHSLSCLAPRKGGIHCGNCNKCAERRRAFAEAVIADPTAYAARETDGVPA